jgi:hypothetical protein
MPSIKAACVASLNHIATKACDVLGKRVTRPSIFNQPDAVGAKRQLPIACVNNKPVHSGPPELLVKALGMLGSDQAGERANAALVVEKQRTKLAMTWDELIISANEAEARAA